MNIGEQIYKLRSTKGLSQGELAEALEVSRQSVSKWETGASVPELDKLVKMSALFGVTLDELVTGKAPAAPESIPAKPDWNSMAGLIFFGLSGISLMVTFLFGNWLGIHTWEGLALAALFALLGTAARFHRSKPVWSSCLRFYGALAAVEALCGILFGWDSMFGFSLACILVLLAWRLRLNHISTTADA